MKNYNIGLDIGTESVGWAVVEAETAKILTKGNNKKPLWGVRLFSRAETAENRRLKRNARRRYDRRRERIKILQMEFSNEINKVDANFFRKLKESKYNKKQDKLNHTIELSTIEKEEIKKYNKQFKTIYHLRKYLMETTEKVDIRLIYLAIHHIIKYRGNFTYQNKEFNIDDLNIKEKLETIFEMLKKCNISIDVNKIDYNKLEKKLLNSSKRDLKDSICNELKLFVENADFCKEFAKMVSGYKFSINKIFNLNEDDDISITFASDDYDKKINDIEKVLEDELEILDEFNNLYTMLFLKNIFKDKNIPVLSELMVDYYYNHEYDLKSLKKLLDNDRKIYNIVFRTKSKDKEICLYEKYLNNSLTYQEFKTELMKILEGLNIEETDKALYDDVIDKINDDIFMPKINDIENGKFPYQLNKKELLKIIENQGKYYPFLLDKIDNQYRIVKLLEFKIPYYVGPLVSDQKSKNAWMERIDGKEKIKITPYNFNEIVDKNKTAEKFILRMVSHCTYLLEEEALPNNSILYSRFKVLNELKQIKINGEKLSLELQQLIIEDLFQKTNSTITENKFKNYLKTLPDFSVVEDFDIKGYSADSKFANNMQSYYDFFSNEGIFKNTSYNEKDAEEIIRWITIFNDKDILRKKVSENYPELSEEQIKKIINKNYSGWGKLSEKFLTTKYYEDKKTKIPKSILDLMYETNENFMQIINNSEYNFDKFIKESNLYIENKVLNYDVVKNLATSPKVKKGIYEALKIVKEIINYMGYNPKNIIIEMARGENKNKKRTLERKKQIEEIYHKFKNEIYGYKDLIKELNIQDKLDVEKLYLYFLQEGKCLYTQQSLDINNLSAYEVDHILPQSIIKDNSLDNKALVTVNQLKKDALVLPNEYRNPKNKMWWKHLNKIGLLSKKKLYLLTRNEYSEKDIQGFINRQLVETRQITKHVANIISNYYEDSKVIYLKASLNSDYRQKYELYKFREINDYHHAHDAYLTAVLGEFKNKIELAKINKEFIYKINDKLKELKHYKDLKYGFVINCLNRDVFEIVSEEINELIDKNTGEIIFDVDNFNKTIENNLYRNDILISKKVEYRTGNFFDETIYSKNDNPIISLKENLTTELYGGYKSVKPYCAVLIKIKSQNKEVQKLVGLPIIYKDASDEKLIGYYKTYLKLKQTDELEITNIRLPFYSLLNWEGQICYLTGASDRVEVCNALQFKYDKNFYKNHKFVLYKLFINNKFDLDVEEYNQGLEEIIKYIVDKIDNEYKLYKNLVEELKDIISYDNLNLITTDNKEKIIIELTKLLNCKSDTANFKFLNKTYSSAFGKKNARTILSSKVIHKSPSGIREYTNEF